MSGRSTLPAVYVDDECPICKEDFDENHRRYCIPCGHVFCRDCLDRVDPRVCPNCRAEFSEDEIECLDKEEDDWSPCDEEREEDRAVWRELGWQEDEVEEEEEPDEDDDDWAPSDGEREEDRAAWRELRQRQRGDGEDSDSDSDSD
ncbi:uncharacterized protein PHACADRAFT_210523 [Phanerochaete carnosa HHB-10118-sp]|uniref:RING-type domain-containing protein n=1 Tax=Phanerochaete carnosa (strain HHB-10118-sp) TaxID=650164 RepID=K5UXB5_PHACS|nr:uncharacterized protein PHACADRAFT_210523 [Phanerochaete carnosa HHB-10118-sp]EKM54741.1 hypothetical protein PHACADRAFT_210523 [Phanerochaete carnosa HHB-10118-sp]